MAAVKNKRSLSRLEFYRNARELRKEMIDLLVRDFGIKVKISREQNYDNTETLLICKCPTWLIENFRSTFMTILNNLMNNIVAANAIYPITVAEADYRRLLQNKAIANCEQLMQEMIFCADVLPTSLVTMERIADMAHREIILLKGWRKNTNEIKRKIINKR